MKAVTMAGGRGTRLAPYTHVLPKPLIPFGDYPILEIIVCQLREAGFRDITMAVGYLAHLFEAYFGDGRRLGVRINYSLEEEPLGTAGPLTLIPNLDEPFIVMNGDLLTNIDYADLYEYHLYKGAAVTIALYPKQFNIELGVLEINDDADVIDFQEKPTLTYLVSMGIYVISPHALDYMPVGKYHDFPDLVHTLRQHHEKVSGYVFDGDWVDVGRLTDFEEALRNYAHLAHAATLPVRSHIHMLEVASASAS